MSDNELLTLLDLGLAWARIFPLRVFNSFLSSQKPAIMSSVASKPLPFQKPHGPSIAHQTRCNRDVRVAKSLTSLGK